MNKEIRIWRVLCQIVTICLLINPKNHHFIAGCCRSEYTPEDNLSCVVISGLQDIAMRVS